MRLQALLSAKNEKQPTIHQSTRCSPSNASFTMGEDWWAEMRQIRPRTRPVERRGHGFLGLA